MQNNNRKYFKNGFKQWSLDKIFNNGVDCCKNAQKGKDYGEDRRFVTCKFIKFNASPGCNKDYCYHLKSNTRIPGKIFNTFI